jgi:hypothetical protein
MSTNKTGLNSNSHFFSQNTKLSEVGLEFTDVVLTERFLLPPDSLLKIGEKVPETFDEIAAMSGISVQDVIEVVKECLELSKNIYLADSELNLLIENGSAVIVDMRPDVDFETEPLHPSAKLFHLQSPQTMLPFLRSQDCVVVMSEPASHAWSAALALRKMKIPAVLLTSGDR